MERYKFVKSIESTRGFSAGWKEKIQVLIGDAIFKALEAERLYDESETSRLFVDKFVELAPKWSKATQTIVLLPKQKASK